jgi:hypothetical protein
MERPILFSGDMVKAILNGQKTQTRRIFKPYQVPHLNDGYDGRFPEMQWMATVQNHSRWGFAAFGETEGKCIQQLREYGGCPFGSKGDRLWVRETFAAREQFPPPGNAAEKVRVEYRAGGDLWHDMDKVGSTVLNYDGSWRPSIHMPRWASRIELEITNVRAERLTDISTRDILAEGTPDSKEDFEMGGPDVYSRHIFKNLWCSVYGAASWDLNPWVWVIEFRREK